MLQQNTWKDYIESNGLVLYEIVNKVLELTVNLHFYWKISRHSSGAKAKYVKDYIESNGLVLYKAVNKVLELTVNSSRLLKNETHKKPKSP